MRGAFEEWGFTFIRASGVVMLAGFCMGIYMVNEARAFRAYNFMLQDNVGVMDLGQLQFFDPVAAQDFLRKCLTLASLTSNGVGR